MADLTANLIPKASAATTIVDSLLTDNGTTLTYTGAAGLVTPALASTAVTPAAIGANTNDYSPGAGLFQRWSASAAYNVTGMVAGADGEMRLVWNIGTFPITFVNELTSTAANRFTCVGGANIVCGPGELMLCQYSTTTSRWLTCKMRSNIGQGTLIVRQPGGVAGTDEVQISHDGTDALIVPKDGALAVGRASDSLKRVVLNGTSGTVVAGSYIVIDNDAGIANATVGMAGSEIRMSDGSQLGASPGKILSLATDTFLSRAAAAVWRLTTSGGSSPCWLQNTAARSRVTTTDVTNITTTLANCTGLSFTAIAGRKYTSGRILLYVENVTAADGIKLDLDGGTGTWTSFRATYKVFDTLAAGPLASGQVTAIATDFTVAVLTGAAWVEIEFSGVANAAGTFIPRFAKNTDAASAPLTLRVNSFMSVEDCP
jgi:hypothetical protein